jgi:hypothetical protein
MSVCSWYLTFQRLYLTPSSEVDVMSVVLVYYICAENCHLPQPGSHGKWWAESDIQWCPVLIGVLLPLTDHSLPCSSMKFSAKFYSSWSVALLVANKIFKTPFSVNVSVDVLIYYPLQVSVSRWPSSERSVCQHVGNYHYNVMYIHWNFISYS